MLLAVKILLFWNGLNFLHKLCLHIITADLQTILKL